MRTLNKYHKHCMNVQKLLNIKQMFYEHLADVHEYLFLGGNQ